MADEAPHERRPRTPLPRDGDQNKKPSFWRTFGGRFWALILILLVLNYLSVAIFAPGREESVTIPYTPTFLDQVTADNVTPNSAITSPMSAPMSSSRTTGSSAFFE